MAELYERCNLRYEIDSDRWNECISDTIKVCGGIKKDVLVCNNTDKCDSNLKSLLSKMYDNNCHVHY